MIILYKNLKMITSIDAKSIKSKDLYRYLSDAVTPRPIAFASSIDTKKTKIKSLSF